MTTKERTTRGKRGERERDGFHANQDSPSSPGSRRRVSESPSFHLSSVPISNRQAKEEGNIKTLQLHSTLHFHQCLIFYGRNTLFEVASVPSKGQCWIAMELWFAIRHLPAKATVRLRSMFRSGTPLSATRQPPVFLFSASQWLRPWVKYIMHNVA